MKNWKSTLIGILISVSILALAPRLNLPPDAVTQLIVAAIAALVTLLGLVVRDAGAEAPPTTPYAPPAPTESDTARDMRIRQQKGYTDD